MGLLNDVGRLVSPLTSPITPTARALYARLSTSASPNDLDIDNEIRLLESGTPTSANGDDGLHDSGYLAAAGANEKGQQLAAQFTTYGQEIKVLLGYVVPLFVSQLAMRYSSTMGPVSAAGKFGPNALAGAALANTTYNVLFMATTYGFTGALDTLSTQADGQKNKTRDLNMLYAFRVLLAISGFMVCLFPLLVYIKSVFTFLHIEEDAAQAAATFIHWSSLGLPGFICYEVLRKYCSASGRFFGPAVAGVVAAPIAIPIMRSDLFGSNTPPIGLALYFTISFFAELVWAYYYLPAETFVDLPPWDLVKSDMGIVIKLGAAGVASSCSDWWAWEALSFFAAWMGSDVLAAQGVLLTTASFWFALPASLMNASSTRVGNYLGEGAHANARIAALTALGLGFTVASMTATGMTLGAKSWAKVYTEDPAILDIVTKAMKVFSIVIALDAIQGVGGGILRGAGLPIEIARIMLTTHYLVGLPLAVLCGFWFSGGLTGLWVGFSIGLALVCGRLAWMIFTLDYRLASQKAQAHIDASEATAAATAAGGT